MKSALKNTVNQIQTFKNIFLQTYIVFLDGFRFPLNYKEDRQLSIELYHRVI